MEEWSSVCVVASKFNLLPVTCLVCNTALISTTFEAKVKYKYNCPHTFIKFNIAS